MNVEQFRNSLTDQEPPEALSSPLRALWFERQGDWHRAHAEVEDDASPDACTVHGFLHHLEGDAGNAGYWYRRAGVPVASGSLDAERDALLQRLLTDARCG